MTASNIRYEIADKVRGIAPGGIGAIHLLARKTGLIQDIDQGLHLLKRHLPYHESDHVLNIAYNLLAGGSRLEHIEVRRHDEVFLDALGAQRIPDPTTAGDFCRRFSQSDVEQLMDIVHETRLRLWNQQPEAFFDEAFLDADGTIAPSDGWCKQGVDIAYNGIWGDHPLVVSLAHTAEPLYLVNRSGNRPSHELDRPPRYPIKTVPRQAWERHKERVIAERQFETLKLIGEEIAEFEYRSVACKKTYRVAVLRNGYGQPGVEPEGVECVAGAGASPVGGEAPSGEAVAAADEVQHVLRGVDPGAVSDRAAPPAGSCTGSWPGTRGRAYFCGWWSDCSRSGCEWVGFLEIGVGMLRCRVGSGLDHRFGRLRGCAEG